MTTPSGVGFESRLPISSDAKQAVMDAGAVLQLRRAELAAAITTGPVPGVEILERGMVNINRWMMRAFHDWREVLSVRPRGTAEQLRISLPNNRLALANGLQMTSVFDYSGLTDGGRALLAAERDGRYLISVGPVQMNIVDRKFVLLVGPDVDGEPSIIRVVEPACVAAAWAYWHRVVDSAWPVTDEPTTGPAFSPRQRQIVTLLATGAQDQTIASALGVSVRTVRADIAEVMGILGVRSRFAAGVRFHQMSQSAT